MSFLNLKFRKYQKYLFISVLIYILFEFLQSKKSNLFYTVSYTSKNQNEQEFVSVLFEEQRNSFVQKLDLTRPLYPSQIYSQIPCRKSAKILVSTTLCIHDIKRDIHVSGSVWQNGIWEDHIVEKFLKFLIQNQECLAIDIGSHIGIFSLFAARIGTDVLSIEPFYDNIIRIHKAANIEKLAHRITLIANAISNVANMTKKLTLESENIGGQSLFIHKNEQLDSSESGKYAVKTITLDDLVNYLPKRQNGQKYEKAVMKIDIEGFELYVFEKASELFRNIDIRAVFMEWGNMPKLIDHFEKVDKMIQFFTSRNYVPYKINKPLTKFKLINYFVDFFRSEYELPIKYWENWSWDVVWIKIEKSISN